MKPLTSKNKKYRSIISTARELFFKHGTKRVSVEEICGSAMVSKMTFYKYFKNKNELAKTILDEIFVEAVQKYRNIIDDDNTFEDKIRRTVIIKLEYARLYGENFVTELISSNNELKDYIAQKSQEYQYLAYELLDRGKETGEIDPQLNNEFIMIMSDTIRILMDDDRIKTIFPDVHERLEQMLRFFFYGIFSHKKER